MGQCKPASEPPAPETPAPPAPRVDAADAVFGAEAMAASRRRLYAEHGGGTFSQIMVDRAEWSVRDGRDGYAWDAAGWFGGDSDRRTIQSGGEGDRYGTFEGGEGQAVGGHAIGPTF